MQTSSNKEDTREWYMVIQGDYEFSYVKLTIEEIYAVHGKTSQGTRFVKIKNNKLIEALENGKVPQPISKVSQIISSLTLIGLVAIVVWGIVKIITSVVS